MTYRIHDAEIEDTEAFEGLYALQDVLEQSQNIDAAAAAALVHDAIAGLKERLERQKCKRARRSVLQGKPAAE